MITLIKNKLSYQPVFPDGKVVYTSGVHYSKTFVLIWWKLAVLIELRKKQERTGVATFINLK